MVATNLGSRIDAVPSSGPMRGPEAEIDYITLKLIAEIDNKVEQLAYILAPILRDTGQQSNEVTSVSTQLGKELEIVAWKLNSLLNSIEL
jgi:hypothetical protein